MKWVDRLLQRWRMARARPWVPAGARVLDIGCHEGEFLRALGDAIGPSVGFDPLAPAFQSPRYQLVPQSFPANSPLPDESFDVAALLATLEHLPEQQPVVDEIYRLLRGGGRVIVTVPARRVDGILDLLLRIGVIDGMSLEEHHGFDPSLTPSLFAPPRFVLGARSRFQFGLNNLFVFRKASRTKPDTSPTRQRGVP